MNTATMRMVSKDYPSFFFADLKRRKVIVMKQQKDNWVKILFFLRRTMQGENGSFGILRHSERCRRVYSFLGCI